MVEKGENAGNQHFLYFPQCFQLILYQSSKFWVAHTNVFGFMLESACLSVSVSNCVQNTSFCQIAGGGV